MRPVDVALMLWQDGCEHELQVRHQTKPVQIWIPCERHRAFARMLDADACRISVVPRTERKSWATGGSSALWVVLQSGAATRLLERFRPAPTLVIRAGRTQQRWALWALSRPLWGSYIEQAGERLSYALHGLRRAAQPETLIPSPFSAPNWIEYEQPEVFTARQVVGHLRDAPPADAWRRAA